jgi:hypothetical protein
VEPGTDHCDHPHRCDQPSNPSLRTRSHAQDES